MRSFTMITIIQTKFGRHHQLLLTPPLWESHYLFLLTSEVHCVPSREIGESKFKMNFVGDDTNNLEVNEIEKDDILETLIAPF